MDFTSKLGWPARLPGQLACLASSLTKYVTKRNLAFRTCFYAIYRAFSYATEEAQKDKYVVS